MTAPSESHPESTTAAEPKKRGRRSILAWTVGIVAVLIAVAVSGFIIWALQTPDPMPEALAALESDDVVTVSGVNPYVFMPVAEAPVCGFIFYAGGRVDERSYAPALRALAEEGLLVLLPSMPLNLAVFSPSRAAGLIADYPQVDTWIIGGHSLGGAMAATYVSSRPATDPDGVDALALWASFPAGSADLSQRTDLEVASIFGSNDGLATLDDIEASRALLPATTRFTEIVGGNHAQFGWYGPQNGDGEATISREDQNAQTVAATLEVARTVCATLE